MAQYGRTWWGEQWLKALDRIDFSNRLPRGRSYANTGKVNSIKIHENTINAKVAGIRPKPYDITIVVPPFFQEEQNVLIENIRNNPLLLSQLLNRQLPQELLSIAELKGIKIFPQSWQDIKLNCSCPDWAVPCKHLAAVIYTIANEIDQNPFLVFNLHRFNLLESLSKSQMKLEDLRTEKIFSFEDCIADLKNEKFKEIPQENVKKETPDFSLIENLLSTLPLLFTANPLFFDKDFKPVIQNNYKQLSRYQPKNISKLKTQEFRLTNDYRYYNYSLVFNEAAIPEIKAVDSELNDFKISLNDLIVLLATTESKHLESYSPSFIFLYQSFHFCNVLAEHGALLPRLFSVGKDKYKVQWIPALLNASVKKVFDDLLNWYPDNLVQLDIKGTGKKGTTKIKFKDARREEAQTLICSLFANEFVHDCYSTIWRTNKSSNENDSKIMELFFDDSMQEFKSFSEKEIPNTIQLWLNRFYLSKKDFSPVLQVHEKEENNGFEVEVLMKDNVAPMHPVESLYAFMNANSDKQFSALKDVQLLSHYMPGLDEIIASKGVKKLAYSTQTFAEVLTGILPAIRLFGIQTLLPKSLQHLLRPQVSVALTAKGKNKSYLSVAELIDFDWKIAMGDTFISKEEFIRLSQQSLGLVKIRDQYVMMNQEDIEKVIKKLTAPSAPKSFTLLQAALSGDYEGAPIQIDQALKDKINEILKADKIALPKNIHAQLRHYQERGYGWMYKNAQLGLGSLLADDMGLGKTLQVITTLQKFKEEGLLKNQPALVIAPTTLLSNWKAEIERFAPKLKVTIFHGVQRKVVFTESDVIITTYGIVRTENEKLSSKNGMRS